MPACRNCQKSKRECAGYDPIFKQQQGPAAIQPAPSSAPQQGGIAATANPYGNQPHMLGGYGGVSNMSYDPALSASHGSPASQQFDYASAIDPALEASGPSGAGAQYTAQPGMQKSQHDPEKQNSASSESLCASDTLHLRGDMSSLISPVVPTYKEAADINLPGKRTVNDLLAQLGPAPPAPTSDPAQSPSMIDEVKHLYYSIYAPGLENFTESKWFSGKGLNKLLSDKTLLEQFGALLQQFAKTPQNDPKEFAYTSAVEARIVWSLANMVRTSAADVNGIKNDYKTGLVPSVDDPLEAGHRLTVFEALLTGQVAGSNLLTQPVPGSTDHHRLRELEFWFTLGNFVCLPYEDSNSAKNIDNTLSALRNLLDGRENRDVLYSIAVVRAIGQRVSEYQDTDTPLHFDESDNKSKLLVAKKFVTDEGAGAGTTNVIRRLCELAARSWATPVATPIASSTK